MTEREHYTISQEDVGKPWIMAFGKTWQVLDFMGRILPGDVGKRIYRVPCNDPTANSILQVENDASRDARVKAQVLAEYERHSMPRAILGSIRLDHVNVPDLVAQLIDFMMMFGVNLDFYVSDNMLKITTTDHPVQRLEAAEKNYVALDLIREVIKRGVHL